MDKIILENVTLLARVGVSDNERRRRQPVVIDVTASKSLRNVGSRLERTIDYAKMFEEVKSAAGSKEFVLLEEMAESVAARVKNMGAAMVRVRVHKPKAFSSETAKAFVEIER